MPLFNKDVYSPITLLVNAGRDVPAESSFSNIVRPLWSTILSDNSEDDTVEHVHRTGCLFAMLVREALKSNPGWFGIDRDKAKWSEFFQKADAETLWSIMALHDVGKHFIDSKILTKPDKLTAQELKIIHRHPIDGAELISKYLEQCGATSRFKREHDAARDIALFHHVSYGNCDNSYPAGIDGMNIPFHAALAAIADVVDALSFKRSYKEAWPIEDVHSYIKSESGKKFHPKAVELTMRCWGLIQEFVRHHSESHVAEVDKIWRMYYVHLEHKRRALMQTRQDNYYP